MKTIGRNDPCPCGSGKKFKQCCMPGSIGSSWSGKHHVPLPIGPDKTAELYVRANVLKTMGRLEEAVESYRQVLLIRPTFAEAHNSLGNALADQGRLDEAVTCYRQAISINPAYVEAHSNLGTVLQDQGKHQEAVASFRRAINLQPAFAGAHYNLGNTLRSLGLLEDAIASYQSAISTKPDFVDAFNNLGVTLLEQGRSDEAASTCRQATLFAPKSAAAHNNLGNALSYAGQFAAALISYVRAIELEDAPDFRANFGRCVKHLDVVQVDAVVKGLLIRAMTEAWVRPIQLAKTVSRLIIFDPKIRPLIERVVSTRRMDLPSQGALTLSDLATVADNALLTSLLQIVPVSDVSLERCMTAARRAMLDAAASVAVGSDGPDEPLLSLYCALARQCFINEYIFSCTEPECQAVEELRERTVAALRRGDVVPALWVITIGAYVPLSSLPSSDALLEQSRAAPVAALVIQQVTEPALERRLRDTISRLTPIDDQVSQAVQRQYEENPYPRWVKVAANRTTTSIGEYVQRELHFSGPQHLRTASAANILVAGCGTGQETIEMARRFPRSRILAVDLSLSSLCYAKRKTTELGLTNVEYAQGDIVALGCVDLIFDVIYSVGVLHHLAEPIAGWKQLCSILREGGLMCLGLYSERARKTVSSGRTFVEDRRYTATPADIRRCREEIIFRGAELGLTGLTGFADFFVVSECRDLLFHVKEHRYTIPQLKEMLKELGLDFLGFSVEPGTLRMYRERFPRDESSADLDNWDVFEAEHPETFVGMYQFWVYKPANASA